MTTYYNPNEIVPYNQENARRRHFHDNERKNKSPFSFTASELHSHERDVVIHYNRNIHPRSSTEGFKRFTKLIENLSIRYGYSKSTDRNQFVIDKVIYPLLKKDDTFISIRGLIMSY
jgi:hypothetical protein